MADQGQPRAAWAHKSQLDQVRRLRHRVGQADEDLPIGQVGLIRVDSEPPKGFIDVSFLSKLSSVLAERNESGYGREEKGQPIAHSCGAEPFGHVEVSIGRFALPMVAVRAGLALFRDPSAHKFHRDHSPSLPLSVGLGLGQALKELSELALDVRPDFSLGNALMPVAGAAVVLLPHTESPVSSPDAAAVVHDLRRVSDSRDSAPAQLLVRAGASFSLRLSECSPARSAASSERLIAKHPVQSQNSTGDRDECSPAKGYFIPPTGEVA